MFNAVKTRGGDVIAEIHADDRELAEWMRDELRKAIKIG